MKKILTPKNCTHPICHCIDGVDTIDCWSFLNERFKECPHTKCECYKKNKRMKKIMFSDKYLLTQAVLNGTKTMTRRVLRDNVPLGNWEETAKHLPYKVGEVVAIAQSYKSIADERDEAETALNLYKIGDNFLTMDEMGAGWNNKMFVKASLMKRHIRITDVKIERLQELSDEDILREGVWQYYDNKNLFYVSKNIGEASTVCFLSAREAFTYLIDKVSGKGTWESNPYVAAYSFELID